MALKSIYIVVRQLLAWARLFRRAEPGKDIEILVLRHQLAVAQRRLPPRELQRRLTWSDRAWLALLIGVVPAAGSSRLRLIMMSGAREEITRWFDLRGSGGSGGSGGAGVAGAGCAGEVVEVVVGGEFVG